MSATAASLALPTLSLRTRQTLSSSSSPSHAFSSLAFNPAKSLSISTTFLPLPPTFVSSSRFLSNVALDDDILTDGDDRTFSPDLKLFVGNLPFSVDSAQLAELFETAGTVEVVEVIYDKMSGRSRGFGFVTMSSVEEAEAAKQQFDGYELDGRALRVNSGPPPAKNDGSRFRSPSRGGFSSDNGHRVHVGNLAWGVDHLALENLFREQGKVLEAKVIYDRESGRSRGFGFVTYSSPEEVNSAIESLDGADLNGRSIRVSLADSKPKRPF
ncbi:hypothetical protein PIB30_062924 [Stylosanthes scabra]|uniref:RRM domain-containing protein n=1 Tax=Stylosanthes scabra TaxID=79078 RepID=A0ABU6UP93_9FABA|nr:hypothetical protein [Stylosanthes scabra]